MLARLKITLILLLSVPTSLVADTQYQVETVAEELNFPWCITFLPEGGSLVTELVGQLRHIDRDGQLGAPITGLPEVFRAGQGGLFDVILDPDFTNNQLLYLSYAQGNAEANGTTVARAKLLDNQLSELTVIFTAAPQKYAPLHYGGRLAWMNGDLLLTTGDGFDFREKAQSTGNHFGKTIRIPVHGDNPSPFSEAPMVWSYGHRNPQGLTIAENGTVYLHEHGPKGGDEINIIKPGQNYGWPAITYGMDYNSAFVSPFTKYKGMQQPIHTWVPSIAPSGLMIYEGDQFPQWHGDLFVGALVDQEVRRIDLENGEVVGEHAEFAEIKGRIRDIRQAPDGSIYIITDGEAGSILRVSAL
ncbi:MAG: glucose/arabinose dehydrogenase [Limisphaerales bacterium]|jgi:glucose/arabinose dehydrogenase